MPDTTYVAHAAVDVHQHLLPAWYVQRLAAQGLYKIGGRPLTQPELQWSVATALDHNDRRGIRASILSYTDPGASVGDAAFNRGLARESNEYLARLVADHPGRFGAFAVLPLPDIDSALRELAYALDVLKLDGLTLLSNYGRYLGDPCFEPIFAELSRRRTPVFLHPTLPRYDWPLPYPPWLMEFVFDTTRAAINLVFSGTLDRHPEIPIILAHGGGTLPFLMFRADIAQRMLQPAIGRPVAAYFRDFYYETTFVTSETNLAALTHLVDPSHLLFGTDFPFGSEWVTEISQHDLAASPLLDGRTREQIADRSAATLFPRLAA